MAPHSSTLAWKIPWMEEPGRLQSMGSRRVGHDWATSLSLFTFMHWRRKWQPTPVFLLENPWWAAVSVVTQSRSRLKWLSSSIDKNGRLCWQNRRTELLHKVKENEKKSYLECVCGEVGVGRRKGRMLISLSCEVNHWEILTLARRTGN